MNWFQKFHNAKLENPKIPHKQFWSKTGTRESTLLRTITDQVTKSFHGIEKPAKQHKDEGWEDPSHPTESKVPGRYSNWQNSKVRKEGVLPLEHQCLRIESSSVEDLETQFLQGWPLNLSQQKRNNAK